MNSISKTGSYLNLYFQVHQPRRLNKFSFFDIGSGRHYFDQATNQQIMQRVARNCYQPTNLLLLKLIRKYPQIKITFSISGTALQQFETFTPEVLESFRMLAATGSAEFLAETYYHSLACLISPKEFEDQVNLHSKKLYDLFGVHPVAFRNTELIYSNQIGRAVERLGFKAVLTEGTEHILMNRNPNQLYLHPDRKLCLFLRNYRLSDDIAFRFLNGKTKLTATKYIENLEKVLHQQQLVNLGMDYETFGEHLQVTTGIFSLLEEVLTALAQHKRIKMINPSDAMMLLQPQDVLNVPTHISWADNERNLSAWLGNDMQQDAFHTLCQLEEQVKSTGNPAALTAWRYLQTSDHFYYMSTKGGSDGGIHGYFSPYASPYEAFMNYMNVLSDLSLQVSRTMKATKKKRQALQRKSLFRLSRERFFSGLFVADKNTDKNLPAA